MTYYFLVNAMDNSNHPNQPFQTYYQPITNFYPNSNPFDSSLTYAMNYFPQEILLPPIINNHIISLNKTEEAVTNDNQIKILKKKDRIFEKEMMSAKKNSESNIINQFFSFFSSRDKSEHLVTRAVQHLNKDQSESQQIISLFYNTIKFINLKRGRKYVNHSTLLNYFTPEELTTNIPQIKQKIDVAQFIKIQELCCLFRKCSYSFLRSVSMSAVLTSKRISTLSKGEHLKKRRRVIKLMEDH